jgi:hypothetical protein
MNRLYTLCSNQTDRKHRATLFFRHLQRRGYQPKNMYPLFNQDIIRAREYVSNTQPAPANQTDLIAIQSFHLEYHPCNPAARDIQSACQACIAAPPGQVPLPDIENINENTCGISRMIVAHHRTSNLSNILSYHKILPNSGPPVSDFLS